jgi:hypothetical protein
VHPQAMVANSRLFPKLTSRNDKLILGVWQPVGPWKRLFASPGCKSVGEDGLKGLFAAFVVVIWSAGEERFRVERENCSPSASRSTRMHQGVEGQRPAGTPSRSGVQLVGRSQDMSE